MTNRFLLKIFSHAALFNTVALFSLLNAQTGTISTYAGNGTAYDAGDGGAATAAGIGHPNQIALDSSGNLYIVDIVGARVRRVDAVTGIITTVAGGGTGGDGVIATAAALSSPCGLRLDASNNIFISETCIVSGAGSGGSSGSGGIIYGSIARVRRVDATTGIITTVAGGVNGGYAGDGGPAVSALLNLPGGMAIDSAGNLYIADSGNQRVRKVDAATGIITTVAGNGTAAYAGDGGPAVSASLNTPMAVALDQAGNIFIADSGNNRIRRIDGTTGVITTVAGTGVAGFNGDGIPAISASLNVPYDIYTDASGNLTFSDMLNQRVRVIDAATGLIWTMAGNGGAPGTCCGIGDNAPATTATLNRPAGLAIAPSGPLFIAEEQGNRVRRVALPGALMNTAVAGSSAATVPLGSSITLTGVLTARSGSVATATSGIGFIDTFNGTSTYLGDARLVNGTTTVPYVFSSNMGTHVLTAMYWGDSAYATAYSPSWTLTVTKPQPVVTLTSSPNPAVWGQTLTLTATLNPTGASGTITFLNGSTTLGTATTSSGTATISNIGLVAGTYSLTAQYSGDSMFGPAVSAVVTQHVQSSSSVTLSSSANPATAGQAVTFTASVGIPSATGTVQFFDGGVAIGSASLTSGAASFTTSTLAVGTHPITAVYSGDADTAGSAFPTPLNQVVKTASTLALTSSLNPSTTGQAVVLTATVTPAAATGTVQFLDGGTAIGSASLSSGVASLSTSTLAAGTHAITAVYSGDANTAGATASAVNQVVKTTATVALSSNANPADPGQSVTFSATVTPTTATGTIQFLDGTTVLGSATITAGSASFTTTSLTSGSHAITAIYSGDGTNTTATSAVLTETVKTSASIALSSSANPATPGQSVTFIATVTPTSATGTIQFLDGTTTVGSATIIAGSASFTTTSLTSGTHAITAIYSGDGTNTTATSAVLTETVKTSASISLSSSANPAAPGQPVNFIATVTPTTATGTIQFLDGTTALGSATITAGSASFTTTSLTSGSHAITAIYSGDGTNTTATSAVLTETVKTSASIALSSSANPATPGQSVNFIATVTPTTATGTIQFLDGTTTLGSATITAGSASFTTTSLTSGSHAITAIYSGDGTNTTATSAVLTETVKTSATIALSASANPAIPGQSVTFIATVTPTTATGTIQFLDGTTPLGSATITAGSASFTTTSLTSGTHAITAIYSGDGTNTTATSLILIETVKTTATLVLSANPNPSTVGQTVTLTAALTPTTATGTVQFRDGTTSLGTATITTGTASLSTSTLTAGTHSLTAIYSGDSATTPATSAPLAQTVNIAPPSSLAAVAAGTSKVNLTYSASPTTGVTYNIYASTTAGFAPSSANRIAAGIVGTSYSATGLSAATTYYFKVTAVLSGNESTPSNQATATTTGNGLACHVDYGLNTQWNTGFTAWVTIQNKGTAAINGWTLTWTWPGNQTVTESWNSNYSQSGKVVTLTNASWNAHIAAGATLSGVGFNGSYSGTNTAPAAFYVNGTLCK